MHFTLFQAENGVERERAKIVDLNEALDFKSKKLAEKEEIIERL